MEQAKAKEKRIANLVAFFESYPSLLKNNERKRIIHLIGPGQTGTFGWRIFTVEVTTFLSKLDFNLRIQDEIAKVAEHCVGSLEGLVKAMTPGAKVSRLLQRLVRENERKIARDPELTKAKEELTRRTGEGEGKKFERWMLTEFLSDSKLNFRKLQIQFFRLIWGRYRAIWDDYHRRYNAKIEKQNWVLHKNMRHILKVVSGPGFRPPSQLELREQLVKVKEDLERYLANIGEEKKRFALKQGKQFHGWLMFPLCNMLQYCFPRVGKSETLNIFRQLFTLFFPDEFYVVDPKTANTKFVEKVDGFLKCGQDKLLQKELEEIDRYWIEKLGHGYPFTEYKEENRAQVMTGLRIALSVRQKRPKGKGIPRGKAIDDGRRRKAKYE